MKTRFSAFIALLGLLTVGQAAASAQSERSFGDTQIVAPVPAPGFPEGMAVHGNRFYVAGQADLFNFGDPVPPTVFEFDLDSGALLRTFPMEGQNLALPHGASHVSFDGQGRLYVIDFQRGVVRIDLESSQQQVYSTGWPIINTLGLPSLPNEMAFATSPVSASPGYQPVPASAFARARVAASAPASPDRPIATIASRRL